MITPLLKQINALVYPISIGILMCIGIYYHSASKNILYKGDIVSKEVTISKFKPKSSDYESTDDIVLEFVEFPEKTFEIDYLRNDYTKVKILLSNLDIGKKIIIDIEKQYYRKKIKQHTFLGIKPSVAILGIRTSKDVEIPILDYNVEVVSKHLLTSYLSFIGVFLISLYWIYEYYKNKRKSKDTSTNNE